MNVMQERLAAAKEREGGAAEGDSRPERRRTATAIPHQGGYPSAATIPASVLAFVAAALLLVLVASLRGAPAPLAVPDEPAGRLPAASNSTTQVHATIEPIAPPAAQVRDAAPALPTGVIEAVDCAKPQTETERRACADRLADVAPVQPAQWAPAAPTAAPVVSELVPLSEPTTAPRHGAKPWSCGSHPACKRNTP